MSIIDTEMKPSRRSLSPIVERHTPQHPLPQEIQEMKTDETVCQFCGVSYLIHHEIKKLEEKVEKLEKELVQYKASRENEKKLRVELKKVNDSFHSLQSVITEKDLTIDKMTHVIEEQTSKIEELEKDKISLVNQENRLRTSYRNHKEKVQVCIKSLMDEAKVFRSDLTNFKQSVQPMNSEFSSYISKVNKDIETFKTNFLSKSDGLERQCLTLKEELSNKIKNEDLLQNTIKLLQNELEELNKAKKSISNDLTDENEKLQNQFLTAQNKNTELIQDVATLQSQLGIVKSDSTQMKEAFNKKQQEVQSLMQKLHKTEKSAEMTTQRMNQEIRHLEQELIALNKERNRWKSIEENLKKQQDELQSQMNASSGESRQLCDALQDAKRELDSLKSEREQMVMSHQNQIMQLRDSFREKLNEAHGNPQEMERRIQIMKSSHENEMKELELHLQENHAIEIGLLREKHEEEIRNYSQKFKEIHEQSESDKNRDLRYQENESRILEQRIDSLLSDRTQAIAEQDKEKTNLKMIIAQLEEKITSLTGEHEGITISLRMETKELKRKIEDVNNEKSSIQKEIFSLKEEVSVLQETVRRECEERFELTEALSTLREQLKNVSSNSVSPKLRTPVSAVNGMPLRDLTQRSGLSPNTVKNLDMTGDFMNNTKTSALPNLLSKHIPAKRGSYEMQNVSNGDISVRDISFSNHSSPTSTRQIPKAPSSAKSEESVESVRRRIAAVIKRK
ncbi:uncharacterized protein LOC120326273 [Styela clava]